MTTQEIVQGNLAGWQFFYTTNRTSEQSHLIEIEGQTTEELERNLHRFITDRKISCSIPAGSIVNAFEWLVTEVPKETEQTRMGMQINGEYFKKLKRQRVRIIYQMSPSEKKIIFFIHKKQDWGYGF
jgi:mRNA-degrading endonuclease RelE of RelBE toxin-antitoxin system